MTLDDRDDLTPIARFHNAAEAGYFAHELQLAEQIPAVLAAEENYDAVAGFWATRYLLCVPLETAARAAHVLEALVAESESEDWAEPSRRLDYESAPAANDSRAFEPFREAAAETPGHSGVGWMPLVLTLAAGSAAFWGVRRLHEPARPAPVAPVKRLDADQWTRLATPANPWTLPHENGRGTRELWIDTLRRTAVIREDADGDGLFETRRELPVQ